MADDHFPYTMVPGKLPQLLKKIRETGVPPKATNAWLKTVGFTSSNDGTLLRVLRYIGLIDASSVPTPAWKEYRGRDQKEVLGRAIKTGYKDLYAVYPDAHDRSATDLSHVFTSATGSGKSVVDRMVSTFKALVAEADFTADGGSGTSTPADQGGAASAASQVETPQNGTLVSRTPSASNGLTVNINVQLTLPEGADEQTFEAFFKAMKTHLLPDPE